MLRKLAEIWTKTWKELVNCRNPYQSFSDWFFGKWKCPKCGTWWEDIRLLSDLTLVTVEKNRVTERRLMCLKCGFEEVVWKR